MANIKGFDETIRALRKFGKDAEDVIDLTIQATAFDIQRHAVSLVLKDTGKLQQSIIAQEVKPMHWQVEAGGAYAPYAPYIEFGTGGLVDVPKEFDEQAKLAWFRSVANKERIKVNLHPHPFMYPAFLKGQKQIKIDLEKELDKLTKATK